MGKEWNRAVNLCVKHIDYIKIDIDKLNKNQIETSEYVAINIVKLITQVDELEVVVRENEEKHDKKLIEYKDIVDEKFKLVKDNEDKQFMEISNMKEKQYNLQNKITINFGK